jgi:hypothetical protein
MKRLLLAGCALAVLAGCSSVSVTRDYDPATDFSPLKTYAWKHAEQPKTGNARIDNDLIDQRVREAVDASLAAKGFVPGSREDADFLVAYFIDYKQRIGGSSVSFGVGTGGMGRYGGVGYNTTVSDYDEGLLTIDIIDPGKDKTIWRGVGRRATYESSNPDKVTKIINNAVSRILTKFPPGR